MWGYSITSSRSLNFPNTSLPHPYCTFIFLAAQGPLSCLISEHKTHTYFVLVLAVQGGLFPTYFVSQKHSYFLHKNCRTKEGSSFLFSGHISLSYSLNVLAAQDNPSLLIFWLQTHSYSIPTSMPHLFLFPFDFWTTIPSYFVSNLFLPILFWFSDFFSSLFN